MLAAYATCDDYPHNAYPGRFLNFKIYLLFGVHAGIIFRFVWIPDAPDFWVSRFLDSEIQGCHLVIFGRGGRGPSTGI